MLKVVFFLMLTLIPASFLMGQGILVDENRVLIGNEIVTHKSSVLLNIHSAGSGLLIPRMSESDISSISNPAKGLLVLDTTNLHLMVYSGSAWIMADDEWIYNDVEIWYPHNILIGDEWPMNAVQVNGSVNIHQDSSYYIGGRKVLSADADANLGIGHTGVDSITTGENNLLMGDSAGLDIREGSSNILLGKYAGMSLEDGSENTMLGFNAGRDMSSSNNTIAGADAGRYFTDGNIVALGYRAGFGNQSGAEADTGVFVGAFAGYSISSGTFNLFYGANSGYSVSTGSKNTLIGYKSGYSLSGGDANTFVGYECGYNAEDSDSSVYVGTFSGRNADASRNTAIGDSAFYGKSGAGATGELNFIAGSHSGARLGTGEENVMTGYFSGYNASSTSQSVFIGSYSGYNDTSGVENVYLGRNAGYSNISGSGNVFLGYNAGYYSTTGNTLIIESSNSSSPLIHGSFSQDSLRLNGSVRIRDVFSCDRDSVSTSSGGTISPTKSYLKVSASGAVTLNSTTAISDGSRTGQILTIEGSDNTNTVSIPNNANVKLNGRSVVLGLRDRVMLIWDGSDWVQLSYSNN